MAKRVADKELTHDNWDQEDDEEEAGHFKIASDEDLSKRKIIKAKRRVNTADKQDGGIFQGFSGFSSLNNNSKGFGAGSIGMKPLASSSSNTFSNKKPVLADTCATVPSSSNAGQNGVKNSFSGKPSDHQPSSVSYQDNIKALNESVLAWIQKHINLNPYVDLSPIFNDYKEHMKEIDLKFSASTSVTEATLNDTSTTVSTSQPTAKDTSTFGASQTVQLKESSENINKGEHYLSLVEQIVIIIDFWFFSVVVAEEGAFHSIRCKLFYKRESDWVELGLGMMNLKKLEEKTQVLVRNDTTLGKILLNIYLAENTPISRSGKNNVILMSIPNPPLFSKDSEGDNSKPATYLIRVKTAQDADELHTQLNANKPSS
ncbi:PREDICTED: nuclear pore complex protein Nup50-like [Acropora digitifera]|uniref:nuclear pore complex protein Nup50-like n=1 Tax=Acropora digitifera TaxID=70779 RepID=UPI00077A8BC8|nr:PREDICTED: nuclear pore complex protein Nup50-like [Acropora digitifera]